MMAHGRLLRQIEKTNNRLFESIIHGIFLMLGLVTVGCVLLITAYLVVSGLPAIHKIGLGKFLFGTVWASTQTEPKFGILPFILTSVYGTAGAILIGREAGSGTRDGFESVTGTKDACQYRQELTSTGDVITTVSQNPAAIGYASLAALKDNVKAVRVDGVSPSEQTVKDGSYAVQRPFVLVTKDGTKLSDAAQKFFDFAVSSDAAALISAAGAVPVA